MEASLAQSASLAPDDRIQLHFALGKTYEDLGRYDEGFRHFQIANMEKRQFVAYDETRTLASMEMIRSTCTAAWMQEHAGAGERSSVPVFIVGMPRSGTTLVEQVLAAHPSVMAAGELALFEDIVERMRIESWANIGRAYIESVTKLAPSAARITDKTLSNVQCLGAIHLALPHARIVHVKRDPVDTCFSCYAQLFKNGQAFSYDLGELGRYYRAYDELMRHWRSLLPPGVMLEVRYEELIGDFERQARSIVKHCGLEWHDDCFAFYNAGRPVRTASAVQVRRPVYATSVGRGASYRAWLGPLLEALG